jgi:hypothetical protein
MFVPRADLCASVPAGMLGLREPTKDCCVIVLRVIGGLLLMMAAAAFGWDAYRYFAAGGPFRLSAAGELWYALDPGSLNLLQAGIQRRLWPELWDPGLVTVLLWPAVAVLGALGLVLFLLGARRR